MFTLKRDSNLKSVSAGVLAFMMAFGGLFGLAPKAFAASISTYSDSGCTTPASSFNTGAVVYIGGSDYTVAQDPQWSVSGLNVDDAGVTTASGGNICFSLRTIGATESGSYNVSVIQTNGDEIISGSTSYTVVVPTTTSTQPATDITSSDATLNGTNGSGAASEESFWVSLAPFDTSTPNIPADVYSTPVLPGVPANATFSTSLSIVSTNGIITGGASGNLAITPNTTYYYVAWANFDGGWKPGEIESFTTLAVVPPPTPAECNDSTFDMFTLGSVNGQDGWSATGPFDQEVEENTYGFSGFGCKVLRISDAIASGSFGDQIFSKSLTNEAGEADAQNGGMSSGTRQSRFEAQFELASALPTYQPGMHFTVSPDRGDGARMSYLRFEDTPAGIDVFFYDVQGETNPANFVETQIANDLSRTTPHTVKFTMDFVAGPSNDVVTISIDGSVVHTGTSWENYYRFDSESNPELVNVSRTVDSLLFRVSGTATPANSGNGFLVDNFNMSSSATPAPTPVPETSSGFSRSGGRIIPQGSVGGQVLGAEKFVFTLDLRKGPPYRVAIQGEEVMELQKYLNANGYSCGPVDGKFGPLTEACVMAFQKANPPLVVDGIVGPLTRAVLNK